MTTRRMDDQERRRRMVVRHHLGRTAADADEVLRGEVAMHSSDPVTPYLATWARVPGFRVEDLDRALYEDRTQWRMHAQRRTLWVVPTAAGMTFDVAFSQKVADQERRKLGRWLADDGITDPAAAIARLQAEVLQALREHGPLATRELGDHVEGLDLRTRGGSTSMASKIPFLLALDGVAVRGRPAGTWRSSQYEWAAADAWFDDLPEVPTPRAARADFTKAWLRAFGPATRTDLKWHTKWTVAELRDAVADAGAVEVDVDHLDEPGLVMPDDLDNTPAPSPTVALLPGLDPTMMAWKQRQWYVDDRMGELFDDNGNSGPVVLVDGRAVGAWGQDPDGGVITQMIDDVDPQMLEVVTTDLTEWLDGVSVAHRFPSGLSRRLTQGHAQQP